LANNHALDFGPVALQDSAASLLREEIQPVGVATSASNACSPRFFSVGGDKKIALLAITNVGPFQGSQVAAASDRARLSNAIASARSQARFVICLVHWGIENNVNVTDEQRELARWLVDHGVDVVVGSHPHCVQPLDFYHGCPIAYSLGNLVFDGAPSVASWNHGALLKVSLNEDAKISSVSLIPVVLEDGLPRVDATPERRLVDSLGR